MKMNLKLVAVGLGLHFLLRVPMGFAQLETDRPSPELGCADFDEGTFSLVYHEAMKGLQKHVMDRGVVRDLSAFSGFVDKVGAAVILRNPAAALEVAKVVAIAKTASLTAETWDKVTYQIARGFYEIRNQHVLARDGVVERALIAHSPVPIRLEQRPGGVCFAGQHTYEDDPQLRELEDALRTEVEPK